MASDLPSDGALHETIDGQPVLIVRKRVRKAWGKCWPPATNERRIAIDPSAHGQLLLELLIHEAMHAGCWQLDEDFVTTLSRDVARIAYKLGFRNLDEVADMPDHGDQEHD